MDRDFSCLQSHQLLHMQFTSSTLHGKIDGAHKWIQVVSKKVPVSLQGVSKMLGRGDEV